MPSVLVRKTKTLFRIITSCLLFRNIRMLYMLPPFTLSVDKCPVCGGKGKHEFTNRYTPLDKCSDCGHVYSRKIPKKRILKLMYKDFSYWVHDKEHQGIKTVEYGPQWEGFLKARIGIARKTGLLNGEKDLKFFEIGCSEGILLKELENLGHVAEGCEMNVPTAQAGIDSLGVKIHTSIFEDLSLEENHYDSVMSFHTVEHLPDPGFVFEKITKILTPDGKLLIEVPCGPEEYTTTDHLQFFYKESLERFLSDYFEEVEIIDNGYRNKHDGVIIGSLYGYGSKPKK